MKYDDILYDTRDGVSRITINHIVNGSNGSRPCKNSIFVAF